ncbi:restriction endonuclease subunit S [Erythrobacter sp. BLCC-B19]|uniref:restriction endonuclease subunit S n=1 Tax=Erythrobacter sp. BLCC-B19 TaxID=3025315 RepID=UPI00235F8E5B|nr:restriction endonuclease subunit S [Erythrobacter sp. BLCC-B19]WDA39601.1 restriction endonuclease subunit S [Erythrobacter sp. BLCC-B19]
MSFPAYPEYKDSGVPWLGEVPVHWPVTRLKNSVADCRNGIWGDEPQGDENDIICVRVADFIRETALVDLTSPTYRNVREQDRESRIVRPGDLLLEKSGGGEKQVVGAVVRYTHSEPAICSNFVARMQLAPSMCSLFWAYVHAAAYAVRLNYRSVKQTSGIQNLDQTQYLDELAAFPPIEEQTAIAAFLDKETAKIDALVAEQERLIELLKEKRQAVISHAVIKGLNPDAPMKDSGIEWLGEIPVHWEVRSIGSVSTKITNGYVGPTRDILVDDGVRYLQSLHIKRNRINFHSPYYVTEDWSQQHAKSILKAGDVLIVQTGDIGQVAVVPPEFAGCNCHALIIVSPTDGWLQGEWLAWVLNSPYGLNSLLAIQTGALHPHLNCGNVKDVAIPLPPMDEQSELVEHIEHQTRDFDRLIDEAQSAITLLQERRAALISAAVTGKIDVRGLVDASVKMETA